MQHKSSSWAEIHQGLLSYLSLLLKFFLGKMREGDSRTVNLNLHFQTRFFFQFYDHRLNLIKSQTGMIDSLQHAVSKMTMIC